MTPASLEWSLHAKLMLSQLRGVHSERSLSNDSQPTFSRWIGSPSSRGQRVGERRERGWEGERMGRREDGRERGWEGERERKREGERERGWEGEKERGREGRRKGGSEVITEKEKTQH